ncbi:MAG TPA: DUF1015 domain-containing protein [Candidatus Limnocylindria bacterium]|jgi:uncharacterized protein (DUF1015 family)|nr:DUF1015 domain-containing protein [Candidatus Limnocylindria bacterium]
MAQVYPFRAFRYNPARAPFDRVLTQPYDKISPAMQEKYYAADPHNLIAVEKGRGYPGDTPQNNVYTRAAAALNDWIRENVVMQDPEPAFYAYTQEYTVPGTEERRTRQGFIGAGKLEEYSAGVVFRHEHTLSGPKADRLELLRHTKMHTGQLFMLYSDPQRRIDAILAEVESAAAPATEMRDEYGVAHRLWVIAEPQRVAAIHKAMEHQKLVIADGHHRYETALNYRNECRTRAGKIDPEAQYQRVMMTFINTRSEGLTILPTHRVAAHVHDFSWTSVRRHLEPWFTAEEIPFSGSEERSEAKRKFLRRLTSARAKRAIGVYPAAETRKRAFYVLTLREGASLAQLLPNVSPLQRELDVVLLHEGILEPVLGITPQAVTAEANLTYEREATAALDAVDSGRAQIAFLLNPCDVEQVMKIATSGEVMPQKSTDFYPKLMSGITMCRVES